MTSKFVFYYALSQKNTQEFIISNSVPNKDEVKENQAFVISIIIQVEAFTKLPSESLPEVDEMSIAALSF